VAVAHAVTGPELLAATPDAPALARERITWLPLPAPRRLERAEWMPPALRAEVAEGLTLAAAPLGRSATAVLVGRRHGPRWSGSELRQLGDLARIAVATEILASSPWQAARLSAPAGRAASAGRS
jgi:hypothetical protein